MNKRYQIFISSTFEDLQDERKAVIEAILKMRCFPSAMELFTAANYDSWYLIKKVIDDSDYFVLIIGGCYGSENEEGVSFTQMEFEYAMLKGKPVIAFIHKDLNSIPMGKSESNPDKQKKLVDFISQAKKQFTCYWSNPDNLASQVSTSLHNLLNDIPAEGWTRSGDVVDKKEYNRLLEEYDRLRKEYEDYRRFGQETSSNLLRYRQY